MVHGRVCQNCSNSRFPVLVQLYRKDRKNKAHGFSFRDYNNKVALAFYADLVSTKLWDKLMKEEIISYDLEVKRAHLQEFQTGGSLLLVVNISMQSYPVLDSDASDDDIVCNGRVYIGYIHIQ